MKSPSNLLSSDQVPSDLVLVFAVSGRRFAMPASAIAEIVLEPALERLADMPPVLAGVVWLRGRVVPVVRPDVLLDLPPPRPGLFRVLVVLAAATGAWALLAERAEAVIAAQLAPVPPDSAFDDCVAAVATTQTGVIPVLAPERLLRRREALALAAFSERAARRRQDFGHDHA